MTTPRMKGSVVCANCFECRVSTVDKRDSDGAILTYHRTGEGKVIHKVRCKKGNWGMLANGNGGSKTKSLLIIKHFRLPHCRDYQPMDSTDAEAHRESLPESMEEYEGVWKR